MALKPSLSLRLGQQLRMTPQLQQAIRLLQLSSGELELEIQEALDSNFMLESPFYLNAMSEDCMAIRLAYVTGSSPCTLRRSPADPARRSAAQMSSTSNSF